MKHWRPCNAACGAMQASAIFDFLHITRHETCATMHTRAVRHATTVKFSRALHSAMLAGGLVVLVAIIDPVAKKSCVPCKDRAQTLRCSAINENKRRLQSRAAFFRERLQPYTPCLFLPSLVRAAQAFPNPHHATPGKSATASANRA